MTSGQSTYPLGKAVITGATGMVGSATLQALLEHPSTTSVISLGRRPTGLEHPKLTEIEITNFAETAQIAPHFQGADTVFHCLATYSARVSSDDYRTLTVEWLDSVLRATEQAAPKATFCLFSASGARPDGGGMSFALRVKGEAENTLFAANLPRKFAFRPAAISPSIPRPRPLVGDWLASFLVRWLPFTGITSSDLAKAMIATAQHDTRTEAVLENSEMRALLD